MILLLKIQVLVNEIMDSMNEALSEKSVPPEFRTKIKPGYDLTSIAKTILRKHITGLLNLLLQNYLPTPDSPYPFAVAVKDWTSAFVGELVNGLKTALTGGVADAAAVIKFFLQDRLGFMGPEMQQMGTSVITSYIMKTYSNTTETTDPATWSSTVQTDENRQSNEKRQPPPSDSYNSGAQAKRRKRDS